METFCLCLAYPGNLRGKVVFKWDGFIYQVLLHALRSFSIHVKSFGL